MVGLVVHWYTAVGFERFWLSCWLLVHWKTLLVPEFGADGVEENTVGGEDTAGELVMMAACDGLVMMVDPELVHW